MPSKTQEKSAPDRDSFAIGTDFSDPEQHVTRVAPPGSVSLNQWPDDTLPEFRRVVYKYCKSEFKQSMIYFWSNPDRECFVFAKALIRSFALALNLDETAFDETFNAPLTDILIQHYFASPDRQNHEEILFPHADFSGMYPTIENRNLTYHTISFHPPSESKYMPLLSLGWSDTDLLQEKYLVLKCWMRTGFGYQHHLLSMPLLSIQGHISNCSRTLGFQPQCIASIPR